MADKLEDLEHSFPDISFSGFGVVTQEVGGVESDHEGDVFELEPVVTSVAHASGRVVAKEAADGGGSKGDVLTVAELAGVMGGKRTSELIPLCHPIALTDLVVSIIPDRVGSCLRIRAEAATIGPTGVEMEAMTAVAVAALTVYDMVKGVERGVEVRNLRLVAKSGGNSGEWHRPADAPWQQDAPRPRPKPGDRIAGRVGRHKPAG